MFYLSEVVSATLALSFIFFFFFLHTTLKRWAHKLCTPRMSTRFSSLCCLCLKKTPTKKHAKMGLATNKLLSVNNFSKAALLFHFIYMGMVANKAFYSIPDTYCIDAIKEFWEEKRNKTIDGLQKKSSVVVLAKQVKPHCLKYHHEFPVYCTFIFKPYVLFSICK